MLEYVVVGTPRVFAVAAVLVAVVRIVRHQGTAMQICRQHERIRLDPFHYCQRLGLLHFVLGIRLELIWKVAIQVDFVRVAATKFRIAIANHGSFITEKN